jgi:GH15 family glucan-1,4-alpha-glucosidase
MPSYDWWEENMGHQHTSSLAAIYAGLDAAASWSVLPEATRSLAADAAVAVRQEVLVRGVHEGRLAKWLDGDGVDGSLLACVVPFGLVAPGEPIAEATVKAVEAALAAGGVYRYPGDTYFGGGRWLLLGAFLGWYYAETGRIGEASAQLAWIAAQAEADGHLPEQVSDQLLFPERFEEWEQRWGPIASPLLWSHAMFLTLGAELGLTGTAAAAG